MKTAEEILQVVLEKYETGAIGHTKESWRRDSGGRQAAVCLGGAIALVGLGVAMNPLANSTLCSGAIRRCAQAIEEHFPERMPPPLPFTCKGDRHHDEQTLASVTYFNDRPETTLDDVLLVAKHALILEQDRRADGIDLTVLAHNVGADAYGISWISVGVGVVGGKN